MLNDSFSKGSESLKTVWFTNSDALDRPDSTTLTPLISQELTREGNGRPGRHSPDEPFPLCPLFFRKRSTW